MLRLGRILCGFLTPFIQERSLAHFRFNLIQQDVDDNKFVDCAIAANASYIVSQDHHFDILKNIDFPKVDLIDIDTFVSLLGDD